MPAFFFFFHGKPSHLSLSRSRVCLLTASRVPANSASLMSPPLYPVVDCTAAPVGLCFAFFKKNRCNRKKWGELSHACSNRPSLRNLVQEMGWMNSQRFPVNCALVLALFKDRRFALIAWECRLPSAI